jgi:hypothetical protein
MSFDLSRFTCRPWRDLLGVVMQQGRVQLDSDWNELVSQIVRRVQVGALDTFAQTAGFETEARAVVPRSTPDGFRIDAAAGALTIGVGRIYVDGVLAENHGGTPLAWDPRLGEEVGSTPVSYTAQPYYPEPPELPGGGPHLVYLDVWQRELTYLQEPDLLEKAVGVDTTARLQTVWQVKVLSAVGNADCATPDAGVAGWDDLIRPSGARLTTSTAAVSVAPNPCLVPPSGGYKGLENQLYRVEIHDDGTAGTATFKWSRDNGSVQTRVNQIDPSLDRLVLDMIGRDEVLRFVEGDWVEITDDVRELHGEPGVIRQIKAPNGVSDATRKVVLAKPLPAGVFPTDAENQTIPARHTRIRRWNQRGKVFRDDGTTQFADLDTTDGVIPVPPAGTSLLLEDGIVVRFDLDGASTTFHTGDHWSFAARTADASVEILDRAPPLGIHHHYARLAVVDFPDNETDCRVLWPPAAGAGESCACDVCVTAESHAQGTLTIQQAIDKVVKTGGVVCIGAGIFRLREPLRIEGAGSVRIRGKGWRTMLVPIGPGAAVRVMSSVSIVLESLAVIGGGSDKEALIAARNVAGFELNQLVLIALPGASGAGTAVSLGDVALGVRVRESVMVSGTGIADGASESGKVLTSQLAIEDNLLVCRDIGVRFASRSIHYADGAIAQNLLLFARRRGIVMLGGSLPGASIRIQANTLLIGGDGIVGGTDGLRITDNEIRSTRPEIGTGIVLEPGLDPDGIGHVWITGNHIAAMPGAGIDVRTPLGSALIKSNLLEELRSGIVFTAAGASAHVSIENNHLLRIGNGFDPVGQALVAIQVVGAREVDVVGNVVSDFARDALRAGSRVAVRLANCSDVRVSGNRLTDLGPVQEFVGFVAGIDLQRPFRRGSLGDNVITRSSGAGLGAARWFALRVGRLDGKSSSTLNGSVFVLGNALAYLLTSTGLSFATIGDPGALTIRGNMGEAGEVRSPMVDAAGSESCLFTDNRFQLDGAAGANMPPMVALSHAVAIVSSNRLRSTDPNGMRLSLELTSAKTFTMLGNITSTPMQVNGAPIGNPWSPLNLIG